jgi:hypothetical protein
MGGPGINIDGQIFGRWTALYRVSNSSAGLVMWWCKCTCGNERAVPRRGLLNNTSKSCGCWHREIAAQQGRASRKFATPEEAHFRQLFSQSKKNAENRNKNFALIFDDWIMLATGFCHYCGGEPVSKINKDSSRAEIFTNGIDRVDNFKGYTLDNCVPCCSMCNYFKKHYTQEAFLLHVRKIAIYQFGEGRPS